MTSRSSRYIEYYEVVDRYAGTTEYYFMPKNRDAENKENFDSRSNRIWEVDNQTERVRWVKNRDRGLMAPIDPAELLKIQLVAHPVPYSDYYLRLQEAKQYREQHQAEESSDLD